MYPPGPAAHAVPGVICLEVFYDSRKGNCNDDDRRQWRKQGGVVGAAVSNTQAKRSGCWVPQPGQWQRVSADGEVIPSAEK